MTTPRPTLHPTPAVSRVAIAVLVGATILAAWRCGSDTKSTSDKPPPTASTDPAQSDAPVPVIDGNWDGIADYGNSAFEVIDE